MNTEVAIRLIDQLGPLVDKWAADEYVQFTSRSIGRSTTTTVSRDALMLLVDRAVADERKRWRLACETIASDLRNHDMVRLGAAKCLDAGLRV